MSATTAPHRERHHHRLIRHAKTPVGLLLIGGTLFLMAWLSWNTWIAAFIANGGKF